MIDTERRKKLAFHLRQLAVGLTTNDDFENAIGDDISNGWLPEQYYRSKHAKNDDPIIIDVVCLGWCLYSDLKNHKLVNEYELSQETLKIIARCILFLHSDQEYLWSPNIAYRSPSLTDVLVSILTLGYSWKKRQKQYFEWQKSGDFDVWPFITHSDYERQLKLQPFLNGPRWA